MIVDRPQGLIEGSGRRGEARRLDQMISARLDPVLVAALKDLAARRGVSLSDVLREAALLLLHREEAENVITFRVNVTNEHPAGIMRQTYDSEIHAAVLHRMVCQRRHRVSLSANWPEREILLPELL